MPRPLAVRSTRLMRLVAGHREDVVEDRVVVEAPLEIRVAGQPITVIMRTPGDDEELVRGFLFTEGLIAQSSAILALRRPEGLTAGDSGNVIDVELATPLVELGSARRSFYASASCGVCGKSSLRALEIKSPKVESALRVDRALIASLPARLRADQEVFEQTGGLHAAGLFDCEGKLMALREDVGRHNAVDKVAGWALERERMPLSDSVLMVSGRLGYEIVQKAVACAIPVVASVSAPSSAALELCERFGVTAVAFVRERSMNLYAHPERIVLEEMT